VGSMFADSTGGDYSLTFDGAVYDTGADRDGDGFTDVRDYCPDDAGTISGCPDTDGDSVADLQDECPETAGTVNGCPDGDADGVADLNDDCPTEVGSLAASGCPDADNDGVVDAEDDCPAVAGILEFYGCPDTDGDGFADAEDACPDVAGIAELNGCSFVGTVGNTVNLREGPGTTFALVGTVGPNQEFHLLGRNAAGDWLWIRLIPAAEETPLEAWISAQFVITDAALGTLPVIE